MQQVAAVLQHLIMSDGEGGSLGRVAGGIGGMEVVVRLAAIQRVCARSACAQGTLIEPRTTSQEAPINAPPPGRRGEFPRMRRTRLAGRLLLAALTAMSAAACGSGAPPNPITLDTEQYALILCTTAPNPLAGIIRRDSQIGYYGGIYYNQSSGPVTMEAYSAMPVRQRIN